MAVATEVAAVFRSVVIPAMETVSALTASDAWICVRTTTMSGSQRISRRSWFATHWSTTLSRRPSTSSSERSWRLPRCPTAVAAVDELVGGALRCSEGFPPVQVRAPEVGSEDFWAICPAEKVVDRRTESLVAARWGTAQAPTFSRTTVAGAEASPYEARAQDEPHLLLGREGKRLGRPS